MLLGACNIQLPSCILQLHVFQAYCSFNAVFPNLRIPKVLLITTEPPSYNQSNFEAQAPNEILLGIGFIEE